MADGCLFALSAGWCLTGACLVWLFDMLTCLMPGDCTACCLLPACLHKKDGQWLTEKEQFTNRQFYSGAY
jgi:hypothetical protein